MERCSLCNGRMIQSEFGNRCMNTKCDNAKVEQKYGYLCQTCNESMVFTRNTAYGDRVHTCPLCKKEVVY